MTIALNVIKQLNLQTFTKSITGSACASLEQCHTDKMSSAYTNATNSSSPILLKSDLFIYITFSIPDITCWNYKSAWVQQNLSLELSYFPIRMWCTLTEQGTSRTGLFWDMDNWSWHLGVKNDSICWFWDFWCFMYLRPKKINSLSQLPARIAFKIRFSA